MRAGTLRAVARLACRSPVHVCLDCDLLGMLTEQAPLGHHTWNRGAPTVTHTYDRPQLCQNVARRSHSICIRRSQTWPTQRATATSMRANCRKAIARRLQARPQASVADRSRSYAATHTGRPINTLTHLATAYMHLASIQPSVGPVSLPAMYRYRGNLGTLSSIWEVIRYHSLPCLKSIALVDRLICCSSFCPSFASANSTCRSGLRYR